MESRLHTGEFAKIDFSFLFLLIQLLQVHLEQFLF
jgi:hypothetical protein